jgi:hypothetical protein
MQLQSVATPAALSDMTPNFLDSSLHMFFSKFVPIFPIIHRPTFVYRECSAPVLLNAIALGSLFLGTPDAILKVGTAVAESDNQSETYIMTGGSVMATRAHGHCNILGDHD